MHITKCDLCKKEIKDRDGAINVAFDVYPFGGWTLCAKCGKPVADLVKKMGLIKDRK